MARNFDGSDDVLVVSAGGMSAIDGGPVTLAFVLKHNDVVRGSVINLRTSAGALVAQINADGGSWFFETTAGFQNMGTASTADNWHLFGVTKATGTATPRSHKYVYDTNTFSHANAGGTNGDSSAAVGASGTCQFGRYQGTAEYRNMELAAAGVWDRVLTDTEFEQLAFSLAAWHAAAPVALWVFDQSATGQTVVDLTGGGANQSSITGTAVSTVSVPIFGYGHEILALSSSAAAGGAIVDADGNLAVTATETGTAAVDRAADGSLAVTATQAGTAAVDRPVDGNLAVTASATGTAAVDRAADGAASVTATIAGTANVDPTVSGTLTETVSITGDAAVDRAASGDETVTATISGTAALDLLASGNRTVTVGLTGEAEIVGRVDVDGPLAVTATAVGTAALDLPVAGDRTVTATLSGAAALEVAISGNLVVTATGSGTAALGGGGGQIHGPLPAMPGSAAPAPTGSLAGAIT